MEAGTAAFRGRSSLPVRKPLETGAYTPTANVSRPPDHTRLCINGVPEARINAKVHWKVVLPWRHGSTKQHTVALFGGVSAARSYGVSTALDVLFWTDRKLTRGAGLLWAEVAWCWICSQAHYSQHGE